MKNLHERIKKEETKLNEYVKKTDCKNYKSKYIGCPQCGSKINKEYIYNCRCPVCREDLRSELQSIDIKITSKKSQKNYVLKKKNARIKLKQNIYYCLKNIVDSYITGYNKINQGDKKMKRSKRAYKYIKEELESQQITLKKVKIIDTVSEYATIDRIDGMLSLASEIGLMNNKKIKKLNIMKMENEKMISKHEK